MRVNAVLTLVIKLELANVGTDNRDDAQRSRDGWIPVSTIMTHDRLSVHK